MRNNKGQFVKGNTSWNKGKHFSEISKEKMRLAKIGKRGYWHGKKRPEIKNWLGKYTFRKGYSSIHKGDHNWLNEGTFKLGHAGLVGEQNPSWKGGYYAKKNEWRKLVFKRDNYTCQNCGIRGKYLNAHHIKEWSLYPDLRYEVSNGITLCRSCHQKLHLKIGILNQRNIGQIKHHLT